MLRITLTTLLAVSLLSGCKKEQAAQAAGRGTALFDTCQQCHGTRGEGRQEVNAPAIAGLPAWYIRQSLLKFQQGGRGTHFDDLAGMQMRPMALSLNDEGDVDAIASYVANMPPRKVAPVVHGGDPTKGAQLFEPCKQCHGDKAEGKPDKFAPPLVHANDWYMMKSLEKFKAGIRGGDAIKDPSGATMRPMASLLADEQAMRDVISYVKSLAQ